MFSADAKGPPKKREFIEYNEKGEPIILKSSVMHESMHPAHEAGEVAPLPEDLKNPGDPWTCEVVSGSMRFFAGAGRFTQILSKKTE